VIRTFKLGLSNLFESGLVWCQINFDTPMKGGVRTFKFERAWVVVSNEFDTPIDTPIDTLIDTPKKGG